MARTSQERALDEWTHELTPQATMTTEQILSLLDSPLFSGHPGDEMQVSSLPSDELLPDASLKSAWQAIAALGSESSSPRRANMQRSAHMSQQPLRADSLLYAPERSRGQRPQGYVPGSGEPTRPEQDTSWMLDTSEDAEDALPWACLPAQDCVSGEREPTRPKQGTWLPDTSVEALSGAPLPALPLNRTGCSGDLSSLGL